MASHWVGTWTASPAPADGVALRLPVDDRAPGRALADRGHATGAGPGEVERAADDERLELVDKRTDDRDVAVGQSHPLDTPGQVELCLDALEGRFPGQGDEDGVGLPAGGPRRGR